MQTVSLFDAHAARLPRGVLQAAGSLARHAVGFCMLIALLIATTSCAPMAVVADAMGANEPEEIKVAAYYEGLQGKRIAVITSADETMLYRYPAAPDNITRVVTGQLAAAVQGATLIDPKDIAKFQAANPYWSTMPYTELARKLEAQRVVYIDLINYSTKETGNAHVWRGRLRANIGVVEGDAEDPNRFAFFQTLETLYPPDRPMGLLDADESSIQLGMLRQFAGKVSNLFTEHIEVVK